MNRFFHHSSSSDGGGGGFNGAKCSAVSAEKSILSVQQASHDMITCMRKESPLQRRPLTLFEVKENDI
jgi:hypothetical protein